MKLSTLLGVPDIPGLQEAGFLTNQTVFNLTELPKKMAFIGAGAVGWFLNFLSLAADLCFSLIIKTIKK